MAKIEYDPFERNPEERLVFAVCSTSAAPVYCTTNGYTEVPAYHMSYLAIDAGRSMIKPEPKFCAYCRSEMEDSVNCGQCGAPQG